MQDPKGQSRGTLAGQRTWLHSVLLLLGQLRGLRTLASSTVGPATFLSIVACTGERS